MPKTRFSQTDKPVTTLWQPELTRLPRLSGSRHLFRWLVKKLCRLLIHLFTRCDVQGLENYPPGGPALIVINHLGDADVVVVMAALPDFPEVIGKIETRDYRILRWVGDLVGIIWIHRGRPDRRALSAALTGFREGRRVLIAPEGRESLTGGLETGTQGAAFLASRGDVPIIPITLTGTENRHVYGLMKKLKRARVSVTIGRPFHLQPMERSSAYLEAGTRRIMETLARQLPPEYRGVFSEPPHTR